MTSERRRIPTTDEVAAQQHRPGPLGRFLASVTPIRRKTGAAEARLQRSNPSASVYLRRTDVAASGIGEEEADNGRAAPTPELDAPDGTPLSKERRPAIRLRDDVRRARGHYVGPDAERVRAIQLSKTAEAPIPTPESPTPPANPEVASAPLPPSSHAETVKTSAADNWAWFDAMLDDIEHSVGKTPRHLSCNHTGAVWPSSGKGKVPVWQRRHLQGKSKSLDLVVAIVLQRQPAGGQLTLSRAGIQVRRTGEWLLRRT
jgi:hypothetical protein